MRGEELHGLNIEELQQLEKSLEIGLSRVMEKKVFGIFCNFCLSKAIYIFILSSNFRVKGLWEKSKTFKERSVHKKIYIVISSKTCDYMCNIQQFLLKHAGNAVDGRKWTIETASIVFPFHSNLFMLLHFLVYRSSHHWRYCR